MKADMYIKLSKYVLLALLTISFVIFGLFFFVGFDNETVLPGQEKPLLDPLFLPALMYWMYILVIVAVLLIAVYQTIGLVKKFMDAPMEALKSLVGPILAIALVAGAYVLAVSSDANSLEAIQNGTVARIFINGKVCEDTGAMVLTDTLIYVQYVLGIICTLATIVSLLGVFKFVNKVK